MRATTVHPIIFNFSNSQFNDKTEGDYIRFLTELFFIFNIQVICSREQFSVSNFEKNHFTKDIPTELKDFFRQNLGTKNLIKEDGAIILTDNDTLVIDIANEDAIIESRNLKHFLTFVNKLVLDWNKNPDEISVIIIANRVFTIEDFPNESFFDLVKNKRVVLFDYKGQSSFSVDVVPGAAPDSVLYMDYSIKINEVFKKHHKLIFGDQLEKFKRKLVGYTGHFARALANEIDRCHFYFYDAGYCEKELKEIIVSRIRSEKPQFIIVDSPESPWLFPPVYRAVSDLADEMRIEIFHYDENLEILVDESSTKKTLEREKFKALPSQTKGILLFDLIHRGNRLKKVATDLYSINSDLDISIHTVIRAVNDTRTSKPNQEFELETLTIIPYHVVRQIDVRHSACPYCNKYEMAHNSKEDLDSIELSPPNFWMLCNDARFIPEKDTPTSYRSPLKAVPDFKKMLRENGAFLALKVKEILKKKLNLSEEQLSNITLIGPNEEGTKEISMCLSYFMDVELILIDKASVAEALEKGYDREQILNNFSNEWWCSSIDNILGSSKSKEVIIFDDFAVTKKSLEMYHDFMKKLDFSIAAFFPIFKFNSFSEINSVEIFSLYSFDLNSSNYRFNNCKCP